MMLDFLNPAVIALGALASVVTAAPCDIYASGKTPCVAAHSSVRALYESYTGPLYQVLRSSDHATKDIHPLPGGVADALLQDAFCRRTTCLIKVIYDQSGLGNHLTQAPAGGAFSGPNKDGTDYISSAIGAPVLVKGKKAYGVFISPGGGYRNNNAKGTATGDRPQGIYAVMDGTHYNNQCCFDYGNAERNNRDTGNGAMEAIYFGRLGFNKPGSGNGPWVQADLENGIFSGKSRAGNPNNKAMGSRFVTAIMKGMPGKWALRGGDATAGGLTNLWSGPRPSGGYDPMRKQGAIVLGIGGDNSNNGQGTFYEGVMTSGYPDDKTEDLVQKNIAQAGYRTFTMTAGPPLHAGSHISMRVTTPGFTNRYIAHTGPIVNTQVVGGYSPAGPKRQASWIVRTGLGNNLCWSFESVDLPGHYIRHTSFHLEVSEDNGDKHMHEEATFCNQEGLNGQGSAFFSWSYPTRYIRHYEAVCYIASNGGPFEFDAPRVFTDDVSFVVSAGFA